MGHKESLYLKTSNPNQIYYKHLNAIKILMDRMSLQPRGKQTGQPKLPKDGRKQTKTTLARYLELWLERPPCFYVYELWLRQHSGNSQHPPGQRHRSATLLTAGQSPCWDKKWKWTFCRSSFFLNISTDRINTFNLFNHGRNHTAKTF